MACKLMVVDDEKIIRESLRDVLTEEGFAVVLAENGRQALDLLTRENIDLVVTDIQMPEMDGMELLEQGRARSPETFFIIITAFASIETAIQALRKGAYDYIVKPIDFDEILVKLNRLQEHKELLQENQTLRKQIQGEYAFSKIIGKSAAMQQVFDTIQSVAKTDSTVLITGRSGTGKELVARAIHYNSSRKKGPFVPVNGSAIPRDLFESELFGHKKGSFTGAVEDREGYFKISNGGTLFLDEIGEIPLGLQPKLLRAIELKEVFPVGAKEQVQIDTRIIAVTNRDLKEEVEKGNFREDLYYRLNVVEIMLPSLNERLEDIPLLVNHFVEKYKRQMGKNVTGLSNEAMRILMNHRWQGEVRELENVIERSMIFCNEGVITEKHFPAGLSRMPAGNVSRPRRLKDALQRFEQKHIGGILRVNEYDKQKTANDLGISLSSLYRKIEDLDISTNDS